jgi:hypothetical protein
MLAGEVVGRLIRVRCLRRCRQLGIRVALPIPGLNTQIPTTILLALCEGIYEVALTSDKNREAGKCDTLSHITHGEAFRRPDEH